jgi:hypothetical protein
MDDPEIRAVVDRHWADSDANDLEGEHQICQDRRAARATGRPFSCERRITR